MKILWLLIAVMLMAVSASWAEAILTARPNEIDKIATDTEPEIGALIFGTYALTRSHLIPSDAQIYYKNQSIAVDTSDYGLKEKFSMGLRSVVDPSVLNSARVVNASAVKNLKDWQPGDYSAFVNTIDNKFYSVDFIKSTDEDTELSNYIFCINDCSGEGWKTISLGETGEDQISNSTLLVTSKDRFTFPSVASKEYLLRADSGTSFSIYE